MGLRDMKNKEMVNLTTTWVDRKHPDRKALARVAELAPWLPHVDTAHNNILIAQIDPEAERQAAISEAQGATDIVFDAIGRGGYYILQGYKQLALSRGDIKLYDQLDDLEQVLYPDKLRVVQYSYREEAGYTAMLESRLTCEHRDLMRGLAVEQGTLLDLVERWIAAGAELGRLDHERNKSGQVDPRDSMGRARQGWIRVIGIVRMILDQVTPDDPVIHDIRRRIVEAERIAEARRGRTTPGGKPDTGELPAEPLPGPGDDVIVPAELSAAAGDGAIASSPALTSPASGLDHAAASPAPVSADS